MSKENEETIKVYERIGDEYCKVHSRNYDEKARLYYEHQRENLSKYTVGLSKSANIFEVGSASGRDIEILRGLGFENIIASDTVNCFLRHLKRKGYSPTKFNLLKDKFGEKYDFILCWAVLVHFTKDEAKEAVQKMHDALVSGGRIALSLKLMNENETEWAEHRHKYQAERFFSYWTVNELTEVLNSAGFRDVEIELDCRGDSYWLECCAEK